MAQEQTRDFSEDTQKLLLQFMISNGASFVRCQNIIKPEYWSARLRPACRYIIAYTDDYQKLPTPEQIHADSGVNIELIDESTAREHDEWFMSTVEEFCKHKAMEQLVYDGPKLLETGQYAELERRSKENMLISLQKELGTDYFLNPGERLTRMRDRSGMTSTGWKEIDRCLGMGMNRGELTFFAGGPGCVSGDTMVRVIKLLDMQNAPNCPHVVVGHGHSEYWGYLLKFYSFDQIHYYTRGDQLLLTELWLLTQPVDVRIDSLECVNRGDRYLVDSPDGWVNITECVRKDPKRILEVSLHNGMRVDASDDHLFQKTDLSWVYNRDVVVGDELITQIGPGRVVGVVEKPQQIVWDLSVDHSNHRYYTGGVCSHNTGKSLFLQNLALNWIQMGLNVVYISLELSEDLVSLRFDAMISEMSTKKIFRSVDDVALKVGMSHKRSSWGRLQIKKLPESGTNANTIRAYLKEYEVQSGIRPDAICIDYLDLLHPNSGKVNPSDLFVKDKYTSEELRALAAEWNVLSATASQLNRASISEQDFDSSHIAGGISKINTADNVLAIFTTAVMKERGEYQIQFLKTRSSSGVGSRVYLKYNVESLRIVDMPDDEMPKNGGLAGITAELATKRTQSQIASAIKPKSAPTETADEDDAPNTSSPARLTKPTAKPSMSNEAVRAQGAALRKLIQRD